MMVFLRLPILLLCFLVPLYSDPPVHLNTEGPTVLDGSLEHSL